VKKEQRLLKSRDLERVLKGNRSWANSMLVVCVMPNDLPHSRFGFAASKRVGNAVARNRAKRLMREAVRLNQTAIKAGSDMVLIARKRTPQANLHQVAAALLQLLRQARLWQGDLSQGSASS